MRDEKKQLKQQAIEQAAYDLIEEKGFLGMSMLAIAKRARASNETLYNWYGDKNGLFKTLIENNAAETKKLLEDATFAQENPLETLKKLGPRLLDLLLGDRAIALNRAAAADPSGELGRLLSASGKETVFPLIVDLFAQLQTVGPDKALEAAQAYLGLLVGDMQIRRVIGADNKPSKSEISVRSAKALEALQKLYQFSE